MKIEESQGLSASEIYPEEVVEQEAVEASSEREPDRQEKLMEEMIKVLESQAQEIRALRQVVERLAGVGVVDTSAEAEDETVSTDEAEVDFSVDDDYSDLYNIDKGERGHRPDGKFLSKHEEALIRDHADLIRSDLPEHEADDDDSEFRYQPETEPGKSSIIEIDQAESVESHIDVDIKEPEVSTEEGPVLSGGRMLTEYEKSNYEQEAPRILAEQAAVGDQEGEDVAGVESEAEVDEVDAGADAEAEEQAKNERVAEEERSENATREVVRKWYHEGGGRDIFSPAYWGAKWTVFMTKFADRYQVNNGMTESEKQQVYERTRRDKIIGGVAFLSLAAGTLFLAYKQINADSLPDLSATPDLSPDAAPDLSVDLGDVGVDGVSGTESDPNLFEATAEFIPDPAFEVPSGGGGERLFNALDINPREWYNVQFDLLDKFPDSFYRMDDGNVGISRPGMLPQEVQEYINNRFS